MRNSFNDEKAREMHPNDERTLDDVLKDLNGLNPLSTDKATKRRLIRLYAKKIKPPPSDDELEKYYLSRGI
jgi:hypothetical protein